MEVRTQHNPKYFVPGDPFLISSSNLTRKTQGSYFSVKIPPGPIASVVFTQSTHVTDDRSDIAIAFESSAIVIVV